MDGGQEFLRNGIGRRRNSPVGSHHLRDMLMTKGTFLKLTGSGGRFRMTAGLSQSQEFENLLVMIHEQGGGTCRI